MTLCSMQCINSNDQTIKIRKFTFLRAKGSKKKKNFNNHIAKIENVLKLARMKELTIEGMIVIFKSLAVSKVVHVSLLNCAYFYCRTFYCRIFLLLNILKKNFIWQGKEINLPYVTVAKMVA